MVREVKKIVALALIMVLAVPVMAFAQEVPWYCNPVLKSADLIAQKDSACIPVQVKVHPTLKLCWRPDKLAMECLDPVYNPKWTGTFEVDVWSNLPFYKEFTFTPLTFKAEQDSVLQSYRKVNGVWTLVPWDVASMGPLPGTGDVIPVDGQSVTVQETFPVAGPPIRITPGMDPLGPFGDIDNHHFTELVTYNVDITNNWCVTAGYYSGQICVAVYQN